MKKLNLKLSEFGKEMLTKEQMKKISGGYGGQTGCNGDSNSYIWACFDSSCPGNTCLVCSPTLPGNNCEIHM